MLRRRLLPAALSAAALLITGRATAQEPAEYYDQNCAACHIIGQGNANGGPDLRDVTRRHEREWLIRFLLDPEALASDPEVVKMIEDAGGMHMPAAEGMTREMAEALLVLIEQRSSSAAAAPAVTTREPFTSADIARGRDLFLGRTRLAASTPACVQCHDAATLPMPGGGRIGPDLTQVHGRLGGTAGLGGWLRAMPTPMMRAVYGPSALTPDESRALTAFFEDAAGHAEVPARARAVPVGAGSLAITLVTLGAIGLFGSRRFRGVRHPLLARTTTRTAAPGGSR